MTGAWLDPDDREQMKALARAFYDAHLGIGTFDRLSPADRDWYIEAMTAAVRSLLPPPPKVKPEEPTAFGSMVLDAGTAWVAAYRTDPAASSWYWRSAKAGVRRWSDFSDDVEIVRIGTGVES